MRYSLVELLRSPVTGQNLSLEVFAKRERDSAYGWAYCSNYCSRSNRVPSGSEPCQICGQEEIVEGRLVSEDGKEQYPVIEGIPRLLPQEYMAQVWDRYPKWLEEYGTHCHSSKSRESHSEISMQQRTAEQFGREWQSFDKMLKDFNHVFQTYFDLVDLEQLSHKILLDAGCGMGRWAFHIAPKVNRVVACDLSFAVEPAYRNCYEHGNVEVVQADIFHPPFKSASFGFIYSLGVLHHLPDPFAGFALLKRLLSDDGKILIYLYYNLENRPLYFRSLKRAVDLVRQFTTRVPTSVSYPVAFAVAVCIYLPLVWYGDLMRRLGLKDVGRKIPLYQTYMGKSFRLIYNDAVDRLTAPIENRYSKREVIDWFLKVGFCNIRISDSAPFWKACGQLCKH